MTTPSRLLTLLCTLLAPALGAMEFERSSAALMGEWPEQSEPRFSLGLLSDDSDAEHAQHHSPSMRFDDVVLLNRQAAEPQEEPEPSLVGRFGDEANLWVALGGEYPVTPFYTFDGGVTAAVGYVFPYSTRSYRELEFSVSYVRGKPSEDVSDELNVAEGDRPVSAESLTFFGSFNLLGRSSLLEWPEQELSVMLGAGMGMGVSMDRHEWDDYTRVAGTRRLNERVSYDQSLGYLIISALAVIEGPGFFARIELPGGLRFTQPFSHNFSIRVLVGFSFD